MIKKARIDTVHPEPEGHFQKKLRLCDKFSKVKFMGNVKGGGSKKCEKFQLFFTFNCNVFITNFFILVLHCTESHYVVINLKYINTLDLFHSFLDQN